MSFLLIAESPYVPCIDEIENGADENDIDTSTYFDQLTYVWYKNGNRLERTGQELVIKKYELSPANYTFICALFYQDVMLTNETFVVNVQPSSLQLVLQGNCNKNFQKIRFLMFESSDIYCLRGSCHTMIPNIILDTLDIYVLKCCKHHDSPPITKKKLIKVKNWWKFFSPQSKFSLRFFWGSVYEIHYEKRDVFLLKNSLLKIVRRF